MKKSSLVLTATAAVAVLALGLSGCTPSAPKPTGSAAAAATATLTVAIAGGPSKWDPATFDWGYQLQPQQAAYDTLIHEAPDGKFVAGLATSWEYKTPTEFDLTLRKGVTFTDGAAFNAAAVKANIDHDKATVGPKTAQLASVSSTEVLSTYKLAIHLSTPNPALPYVFSQAMGMIASPTALKDLPALYLNPVGAGPYKLDASKTVASDHYTFVKNPDYWDATNVKYGTIVFRLMADSNAVFNAVRTGQVDMGVGSPQTVATAPSAGLKVLSFAGGMYSVLLQDRKGTLVPALGNVKVRQALNFAVDKEAIAKTLLPGRATSQIFGPATEAYDPALDSTYKFNLSKAKSLLADAGYAGGFSFDVLSTPGLDTTLQAIAADLKKVNVTLNIVDKPPLDYVAARTTAQYPAYFGPNTPTNAYLDASNWTMPTGALNSFKVKDQTMVDLFTEAASQDDVGRAATYKKLSKRVVDQAWFLMIDQATSYYYYNPKTVAGVQATPGQIVPFIGTFAPAK
jgi:peptide/nickel transport system substrate-binding protein